jgi:hypothetical protein
MDQYSRIILRVHQPQQPRSIQLVEGDWSMLVSVCRPLVRRVFDIWPYSSRTTITYHMAAPVYNSSERLFLPNSGFQTSIGTKLISLPSIFPVFEAFYRIRPSESESSEIVVNDVAWWSAQLVDLILNERISALIFQRDLDQFQSNADAFVCIPGVSQANMCFQTENALLPHARTAIDIRSAALRGALHDVTRLPAVLWEIVVCFAIERHWPHYFVSIAKPLDNNDHGLDVDLVATVQAQTDCVPQIARRALRETGNIVDAILALTQ